MIHPSEIVLFAPLDRAQLIRRLVAQHPLYERGVGCGDGLHAAQVTLTLGRFFGQDVIPEGLSVLVSAATFFKTLGRTTVGFQLWHLCYSAIQ
jgi:hypothetical protein